MLNLKIGMVMMEVGKVVEEVKVGKIDFKVDKYGNIYLGIGKVSFEGGKICDNVVELINQLNKLKLFVVKGMYIKSIYLSLMMFLSIQIDIKFVVV